MSNTQSKVVLGSVIVVASALVACTAGVGSPVDIGQSYGDSPGQSGTSDRPGVDNQDPANGTSRASGGEDNGAGSGAGSGAGNGSGSGTGSGADGDCPPCDGNVTCELTSGGQSSKTTLPLKTKGGVCAVESQGGDIVLACGGQILQNGTSVGTWKNCTKAKDDSAPDAGATPPPTQVDAGTNG